MELQCESFLILPATQANVDARATLAADPEDRWDNPMAWCDTSSACIALFDIDDDPTPEEAVAPIEETGTLRAVAGRINNAVDVFCYFLERDFSTPTQPPLIEGTRALLAVSSQTAGSDEVVCCFLDDSISFSPPAPQPSIPLAEAKEVALLHEAGLNRNGAMDAKGPNFRIVRRAEGLSQTDLARAFLESREFAEAVGGRDTLSNRDRVRKLHENILNRGTDGDGEDFWTQPLDNGLGRDVLPAAFAGSEENRAASPFVETLTEFLPGAHAPGARGLPRSGRRRHAVLRRRAFRLDPRKA